MNTITLNVESPRVYTKYGVPISVTGIAQVKIQGQSIDMLRAACELFLGKSEKEIAEVIKETLEGHQRAIMASMTVEDIYKNRKEFSNRVFEVASSDMIDMGFTIVSYTIKDISDEEGYLKALGLARTAEVKSDARMGEAGARKDAAIEESLADQQRLVAKYLNETDTARAQREFELKKASYDLEVFTKKADSDLAFSLQAAKTRQKIKEEQMTVEIVEKSQEILLQEQELLRKGHELHAVVNKTVEAEAYKQIKIAEAVAKGISMGAKAEAEAIMLRADAQKEIIEAKAKVETEMMAMRASAYKDYNDAAKIEMLMDVLPRIAAEVAAPLTECRKVTMVSAGDAPVGPSRITGEILDIMSRIHETVVDCTRRITSQPSTMAAVGAAGSTPPSAAGSGSSYHSSYRR